MLEQETFGLLGGDSRQAALAASLVQDGHSVFAWGLEGLPAAPGVQNASPEDVVARASSILLPLPVSKDGRRLNAPFAAGGLPELDGAFWQSLRGKTVFGGQLSRVKTPCPADLAAHDYAAREEFAVRNACLTAEGAVEIALRESERAIAGSACLVAGYGRIGRALAQLLRAMGARVTASARKPRDIAWIEANGCRAVQTSRVGSGEEPYDLVFNTIPAPVFTRTVLARLKTGCIVIDLASLPGGVDFSAAKDLGLKAVQALSLPGKTAPESAAEIIKQTVYTILEEEKR